MRLSWVLFDKPIYEIKKILSTKIRWIVEEQKQQREKGTRDHKTYLFTRFYFTLFRNNHKLKIIRKNGSENEKDDDLHSNSGNDYLQGDSGDDFLFGNEGNDVLIGYEGRDTFICGSEQDKILGFNSQVDTKSNNCEEF